MAILPETFKQNQPPVQQEDESVREQQRQVVDSLEITRPEDPITEPKLQDNTVALTTGTYGGAVLTKVDTTLKAVSPGTVMVGQLVIQQSAVIEGIHFKNSETNRSDLIVIKSPAKARFINCTFQKDTDLDGRLIVVEDGAKAAFSLCLFTGGSDDSNRVILTESGTVTDVNLFGCENRTPNAIGIATQFGSI